MIFSSSLLEKAVNELAKLPGIGKKTALRLALHLLKQPENEVSHFCESIENMRKEIKFCSRCYNISDKHVCNICDNVSRKQDVICVVENIRDVMAIESTQHFNGVFHVLGGIISPLDGVGPEQLNIEPLIQRVQNNEITEIVFALNPNIQGDTTIYYIGRKLKEYPIKI
jgi:recombination protein RecR